MSTRPILLNIIFSFLLLSFVFGVSGQKDESSGNVAVDGRIIGYSMWSRITPINSLPQDAFLLLVLRGDKQLKANTFVKIRYRVTAQEQDDLPPELFEKSTVRSLVLKRDKTCDESTKTFIYGKSYEGFSDPNKKYLNLVVLPGAEEVSLPNQRLLPCYSFHRNRIEGNQP